MPIQSIFTQTWKPLLFQMNRYLVLLTTLLLLSLCNSSNVPVVNDLTLPQNVVAERQVVRTNGLSFFQGLTLDPCVSILECTDGRVCARENGVSSLEACNGGQTGCYCSPPSGRRYCHARTPCDDGETCVHDPKSALPFCASKLAAAYDPTLTFMRRSVKMNFDGLTLEPCTGMRNCNVGRECIHFSSPNRRVQCMDGHKCYCYPVRTSACVSSIDCDFGEMCASIRGVDRAICVSRKTAAYVNAIVPFSMHKKEMPSPEEEALEEMPGLKGMTGDYCEKSIDCNGGRVCKEDLKSDKTCSGPTNQNDVECVCKPKGELAKCAESNDCEAREVCAKLSSEEEKYVCVSTVTAGTTLGAKVKGKRSPRTRGAGLGLFPCTADNNDCKDGFVCTATKPEGLFNGEEMKPCSGSQETGAKKTLCMCIPNDPEKKKCSRTLDCKTDGEVCARMPKKKGPRAKPGMLGFCISEDVEASLSDVKEVSKLSEEETNSGGGEADEDKMPDSDMNKPTNPDGDKPTDKPGPKPSGEQEGGDGGNKNPQESPEAETSPEVVTQPVADGTCIDAELLGHLSGEDLVFESHSLSTVLCDESGSCATPGHIVRFRGRAMMMKSYCETTTCEESLKLVNSPRYKIGLSVPSKTDGLVFTAFAARYETRAEEAALSAAVHIGL